jgi:hypothetical protein
MVADLYGKVKDRWAWKDFRQDERTDPFKKKNSSLKKKFKTIKSNRNCLCFPPCFEQVQLLLNVNPWPSHVSFSTNILFGVVTPSNFIFPSKTWKGETFCDALHEFLRSHECNPRRRQHQLYLSVTFLLIAIILFHVAMIFSLLLQFRTGSSYEKR